MTSDLVINCRQESQELMRSLYKCEDCEPLTMVISATSWYQLELSLKNLRVTLLALPTGGDCEKFVTFMLLWLNRNSLSLM